MYQKQNINSHNKKEKNDFSKSPNFFPFLGLMLFVLSTLKLFQLSDDFSKKWSQKCRKLKEERRF